MKYSATRAELIYFVNVAGGTNVDWQSNYLILEIGYQNAFYGAKELLLILNMGTQPKC